MVSWRKLFNKFLFLKSASPPAREESFFSFSFHEISGFNHPFHSLYTYTPWSVFQDGIKRNISKYKSQEVIRLAGLDARQLHASWFILPIHRWAPFWQAHQSTALLRRLKRDTVLSGQQGTYSGISCAKQTRESTTAQLARRQSTSRRPLLFLLNFLLIKISVLFHSVFTVLFSFPSQYLFTIGLWFNI